MPDIYRTHCKSIFHLLACFLNIKSLRYEPLMLQLLETDAKYHYNIKQNH